MRISAVLSNEKGQIDNVIKDMKAIGVIKESITISDFAEEELQDTLKEEFEEMSFIKEEMGIFMNVRPFMPAVDVIKNTAGIKVSVDITPEQKDKVEEVLSNYQPRRVMFED